MLKSTGKVVDTKHVIFNTQQPLKIELETIKSDQKDPEPTSHIYRNPINSQSIDPLPDKFEPPTAVKDETESETDSDSDSTLEERLQPNLHNRRTLAKPNRYGFLADRVPTSLEEAMEIPEWKESALREFSTIEDQGLWEDADKNTVTNPLNTTPVFKITTNAHGKAPILKTQLCVQGFNQRYGLDYLETYAPTGKVASLRGLLTYAADKKLNILQLDVKGAFLHSELDKKVFIKTPHGFGRSSKYLKLKKMLYGLKQAPRNW